MTFKKYVLSVSIIRRNSNLFFRHSASTLDYSAVGMRIDTILTIPIPYRFLLIDSILLSILILTSAEVGSRGELRRTSHRPRLTLAALARRHLFLINGDNKLAHIKLPAMAAGGAGGNSGKTYSFKVVLLGGGCVGKTSLGPVEPLAPRLTAEGLAASSEANS